MGLRKTLITLRSPRTQRPDRVGVKADKDGYGRPSVGGPIGYVGLGVVLLLMVGSQEGEISALKKGVKKWDRNQGIGLGRGG